MVWSQKGRLNRALSYVSWGTADPKWVENQKKLCWIYSRPTRKKVKKITEKKYVELFKSSFPWFNKSDVKNCSVQNDTKPLGDETEIDVFDEKLVELNTLVIN